MATTFTRACYCYDVLLLRRIARDSMGCLEKALRRCPASSPARRRSHGCEKGASRKLMVASIARYGHLKTLEV